MPASVNCLLKLESIGLLKEIDNVAKLSAKRYNCAVVLIKKMVDFMR